MTKQLSLASPQQHQPMQQHQQQAQQQQQQSLSDAIKDSWNSLRYRWSFRSSRLIGNFVNSSAASGFAESSTAPANRHQLRLRKSLPVWLLGNKYSLELNHNSESERLSQDLSQLTYLTYRRGIQPAMVSNSTGRVYRTDAGWGCMYRCAQMLLATAVSRIARSTTLPLEVEQLFAEDGPLSLVALLDGCSQQPGDWAGPATACRALSAAVKSNANFYLNCRLKVHLADDSCVCKDRVLAAWMLDDNDEADAGERLGKDGLLSDGKDDDNATFEQVNPPSSTGTASSRPQRPPPLLLLLLPLRLGGGSLAHPDHWPALQSLLRLPSCLGVLGGRPRRSVYFCGYQGDRLLGLDPHERCVRDWRAQLKNIRPRLVSYRRLDPSCAAGFLLDSKIELDRLLNCLETECRGLASVVQSISDLWPPSGLTITSLLVSDEGSCYADVVGRFGLVINDKDYVRRRPTISSEEDGAADAGLAIGRGDYQPEDVTAVAATAGSDCIGYPRTPDLFEDEEDEHSEASDFDFIFV